MHNTQQILKLIVLSIITLAVLGVIAYLLIFSAGKSQEAAKDTQYEVYERFAQRYYGLVQYYDGVCNDMKPVSPARCEDSEDAYRVYEQLENGMYNCTDKGGYQGQLRSIPRDGLSCR